MTLARSAAVDEAPPAPPAGIWLRLPLPELLLSGALAANLVIVLMARHFPYQDAPNHLARYVLIDRLLSGEAVTGAAFHWVPASYIAIDLLGVLLVHLFGPHLAGQIITAMAVVLPTAGLYFLLRAAAPAARGLALVGTMLTFSWFLMAGLLNFVIGFGLALCFLAWWWPRRARVGHGAAVTIAGATMGLFFVHLSAPLIVLGVMVAATAAELLHVAGFGRVDRGPMAIRSLMCGLAAAILAFAAAWWWTSTATQVAFDLETQLVFRSIPSKIAAFGAPFYSLSLAQAGFMAASWAALLLVAGAGARRRWTSDPFVIATLLFLGLFLVFPKDVGGAGGSDVRWLMPVLFLPFCSSLIRPDRVRPLLLVAVFALSLGNAAVVWSKARLIDRELDDFDRVLAGLPEGSRVLSLTSLKTSYPRVTPFEQYAFWHIINKKGHVPGLFALSGSRERDAPLPHLQHFVVSPRTYFPLESVPLDWARVAAEYDYIVQMSDEEAPRAYVAAHAHPVLSSGAVALYRVDSAPSDIARGGER
jgi:hypothetical protein